MKTERCAVSSLSTDERWRIGNNEISFLKVQLEKGEITQEVYRKSLKSLADFISGISDRIVSDGVSVEFFVQ